MGNSVWTKVSRARGQGTPRAELSRAIIFCRLEACIPAACCAIAGGGEGGGEAIALSSPSPAARAIAVDEVAETLSEFAS